MKDDILKSIQAPPMLFTFPMQFVEVTKEEMFVTVLFV